MEQEIKVFISVSLNGNIFIYLLTLKFDSIPSAINTIIFRSDCGSEKKGGRTLE